jgi:hypothetical protein
MVAEPDRTPYTTPDVLTVARDVLVLLQVPPALVSASARVALSHTALPVPVIVPGFGVTLTVSLKKALSAKQLLDARYRMRVMPAPTPLITPVALLIVATKGAELLQETVVAPVDVALVIVAGMPVQSRPGPVITPAYT